MKKSVFRSRVSFLILLFSCLFGFTGCSEVLVGYDDLPSDASERVIEVEEKIPEGAIPGNVYLNISCITLDSPILNLHGITREEAFKLIKEKYGFSMKLVNKNPGIQEFKEILLSENRVVSDNEIEDPEEFYLPDIIAEEADKLLDRIYSSHLDDGKDSEADYTLELPLEEYAEKYSSMIHDAWSLEGAFNVISSYDRENDEFLFSGARNGYEVDRERLQKDIVNAFEERDFNRSIETEGVSVSVSADAVKEMYRELASYETKTTNVAVRNKNVSLAADAINGTIIKPGEEFSYNGTVGQRTVAKGYGEAGAYLNGEVVQEVGGGVCQVSTTLYNAIFRSGIKSTERTSHTFAPSYVTPGLDATVSWGGPDYKFVNNSPYPIGIRAHYENRRVKVSIFGVPLLPENETWDLVAVKTETLGVPSPVIITSGKAESGSAGSVWEAYKVIYNNGEETERIFDHKSKYVGHTPRVYATPPVPQGITPEDYNALMQALLNGTQGA